MASTNLAGLILALLLGLAGCSMGGSDGSGLTFSTPLMESAQPASTPSLGATPDEG